MLTIVFWFTVGILAAFFLAPQIAFFLITSDFLTFSIFLLLSGFYGCYVGWVFYKVKKSYLLDFIVSIFLGSIYTYFYFQKYGSTCCVASEGVNGPMWIGTMVVIVSSIFLFIFLSTIQYYIKQIKYRRKV